MISVNMRILIGMYYTNLIVPELQFLNNQGVNAAHEAFMLKLRIINSDALLILLQLKYVQLF